MLGNGFYIIPKHLPEWIDVTTQRWMSLPA